MTLFSTINQPLILWFFCYLGFLSGLIFFAIFSLTNLIRNKHILKQNITKKGINKAQKQNKKKFAGFFINVFSLIFKSLSIVFSVLTLFCVLLLSYYLNLLYNYGEVTFVNIIFYCCAFVLANIFLKTLAKFLHTFYNDRRARRTK